MSYFNLIIIIFSSSTLKLTIKNFTYVRNTLNFNFGDTRYAFFAFHMKKYDFDGFARETFYLHERELINSIIPTTQYDIDINKVYIKNNSIYFNIINEKEVTVPGKYLYFFIFNSKKKGFEIFIFKILSGDDNIFICRLIDFSGKILYSKRRKLKHFKFYNCHMKKGEIDNFQILREEKFSDWKKIFNLFIFSFFNFSSKKKHKPIERFEDVYSMD